MTVEQCLVHVMDNITGGSVLAREVQRELARRALWSQIKTSSGKQANMKHEVTIPSDRQNIRQITV